MKNFAELYPASARMQELCTNGLFLNLLDFPEALRLPYRQLQTQVLEGALPGASLLLYECSVNAIRFPALIAAAIAYRQASVSASDKAKILLSLADPKRLLTVLHAVFLNQPRPEAEPYLAAADAAEALFSTESFHSWIFRDSACASMEMGQATAGSSLITCLTAFNEMISPLTGFYRHLQEQPQDTSATSGTAAARTAIAGTMADGTAVTALTSEGGLLYTYNLDTVDPSPFILYKNREYLLAQSWDADSRRLFYRAPASGVCMIGEPLAIACSADTAARSRQASLDDDASAAIRPAYRMPDRQRPHFLDHWLSMALAKRDRGYLLLSMEQGMGKSLYTSLLDPASPYYFQTSLFSNCSVLRYPVSVLPETTEPASFLAFVQAEERRITGARQADPVLPPSATSADYARAVAISLNHIAAADPTRKVLLIVDGMQWMEAAETDNKPSFAGVFPHAAQLDANVYILLTSLPESAAVVRELLHTCDPAAEAVTFTRSHEDYRRTLRAYITETLLRRTGDQSTVNRMEAALHGSFAEAGLLRNVYPLCREAADSSPERFLKRQPEPGALTELYIARLTELYGPKYGHTLEQVLNTLALCPGPTDLRSFGQLLPDHPDPVVLRMILRDMRPFLVLTDGEHAAYRESDVQTAVLTYFAPQWRILCEDILRERRQLLASSADPFARTDLLTDIDLYAAELAVPECVDLLTSLGKLLAPDTKRAEALPDSVIGYFQAVSAKYDDEARNPLRMDTIAALSLSRRTSERLIACRRMESLRETIHFNEKLYNLYCRRYAENLSLTDPLAESTILALAAFRRKTDTPADTAFLWHTENLSRGSLYDALKRYGGGTVSPEEDASDSLRGLDPLRLDYVRTLLPAVLVSCRAALQEPVPQECAVTSHQLVSFCETMLLAMLPVLCIRGCMPEAGDFFRFMQDLLQQTYALRKNLAEAIAAYGDVPHADIDYREPLYTVSAAEVRRREALSRDLFEWVLTFPRSQRLRYYADHTPQWRLLESVLRLEDPAYAAVRGPVPQNRANDLCQSLLQQSRSHADTALHADVVRLRFLLEHCSLSTRRSLEAAEALGSRLLEADPYNVYANAEEVVADFSWLNQVLQKGRSFFSSRQSDDILGVLRESFIRILENNQFYDYLITAQSRLDALEYGPLVCEKRVEDAPAPVEKLTALQAFVIASPDKTGPRRLYADYLASFLEEHGSTMPGSFLDSCVTWCLDMNPPSARLAGVVPAVLYERWKKLGAPDPAFCDLDGTLDTEGTVLRSRLYYRRAASCYLLEGGSLRIDALKHAVETQNTDPAVRAFLYLCLAISAGTRSLASASRLLAFSEEALRAAGGVAALKTATAAVALNAATPAQNASPAQNTSPAQESSAGTGQDVSALRAAILRAKAALLLLSDTGSLSQVPRLLEEYKASGTVFTLSLPRYARIWPSRLSRQIPKRLCKDLSL